MGFSMIDSTVPISERFQAAIEEAFGHLEPNPPPPLATDAKVSSKRKVSIPKIFREELGIDGPLVPLSATVSPCGLELRPVKQRPVGLPTERTPQIEGSSEPESQRLAHIKEALSQAFDNVWIKQHGLDLVTTTALDARGRLTLDPMAWHRLGWKVGDRIRVVLEENHLRLVRVE